MKPVDQTSFHGGKDAPENEVGNCWSACIASILEVPIEEVPTFAAHDDWWGSTRSWLFDRGYQIVPIQPQALAVIGVPMSALNGWFIASGRSPRGDFNHCVVASGHRVAHDPHPSRAGLAGPVLEIAVIYRDDCGHLPEVLLVPQVDLVRAVTTA